MLQGDGTRGKRPAGDGRQSGSLLEMPLPLATLAPGGSVECSATPAPSQADPWASLAVFTEPWQAVDGDYKLLLTRRRLATRAAFPRGWKRAGSAQSKGGASCAIAQQASVLTAARAAGCGGVAAAPSAARSAQNSQLASLRMRRAGACCACSTGEEGARRAGGRREQAGRQAGVGAGQAGRRTGTRQAGALVQTPRLLLLEGLGVCGAGEGGAGAQHRLPAGGGGRAT